MSAIVSNLRKFSAETVFFTVAVMAVGTIIYNSLSGKSKNRGTSKPDLSEEETEKILGLFLKKLAEGAGKFDQAFAGIKQQIASSGNSVSFAQMLYKEIRYIYNFCY